MHSIPISLILCKRLISNSYLSGAKCPVGRILRKLYKPNTGKQVQKGHGSCESTHSYSDMDSLHSDCILRGTYNSPWKTTKSIPAHLVLMRTHPQAQHLSAPKQNSCLVQHCEGEKAQRWEELSYLGRLPAVSGTGFKWVIRSVKGISELHFQDPKPNKYSKGGKKKNKTLCWHTSRGCWMWSTFTMSATLQEALLVSRKWRAEVYTVPITRIP